MSSAFSSLAPAEIGVQPFQDDLQGNIFRNVDGFYAKYFEDKPWSLMVQNKLQEPKSAEIVSKLTAGVAGIANSDVLADWLADFQALFFTADQTDFHFQTQPPNNAGSTAPIGLYFETSHVQSFAGNTRAFGEFHQNNAPNVADDGEDKDIPRFGTRAQQIFKNQSARCFVHGFLVRGTTLELWVFDRSGAYSSERIDLAQTPDLLVQALAGYAYMSDEEAGFNTFVKHAGAAHERFVTFDDQHQFYLQPELIAAADYVVGPGTTCYAASTSMTETPDTVIKFSWREEQDSTEVSLLQRAQERNAWGIVQLVAYQDLVSTFDLRKGLQFPQPFANRTFSCIASAPLGRPIRQFATIPELLEVLRDLVRALQSLYINTRILHRDVAIKNLIITPQHSADGPKGVLIDFNAALDLDNARPVEPMVGSDGFMAIGILFGQRHTYRHDLESLFYVFLWIAIANERLHDEANDILNVLPKTSRLWNWCSMDFGGVGKFKAADMSPQGFEKMLDEFSNEFKPLQGLAQELHALVFPVRDGKIFTGTDTDQVAVQRLYDGMANAFDKGVTAFQS